MRGLTLVTAPASEPVSLAEAKAHLRIEAADDDSLIGALITAARQSAEAHMRRALMSQTWRLSLDRFPAAPQPWWDGVRGIADMRPAICPAAAASSSCRVHPWSR